MAVDSRVAFGPSRAGLAAADDQYVRASLVTRAEGLMSVVSPRSQIQTNATLVDGSVYFMPVGLCVGDVVTNIVVHVNTAGATVTLSKVGLYSTSGTRLALSADQATGWESTGLKTIAMITPYTVPTSGAYYVAIVSKSPVTLPNMLRTFSATTGVSAAIGTGIMPWGVQAGQTDLPASATIAAGTFCFWAGVS